MSQGYKEVLFVGGLRRAPVHDALERETGWTIHWYDHRPHSLKKQYKLLARVQILVVCVKLVSKETKRLVSQARRRGVTVLTLPAGYSPACIVYRLREQQRAHGGQNNG